MYLKVKNRLICGEILGVCMRRLPRGGGVRRNECSLPFSFRACGILSLRNVKRLLNISGLTSINQVGVGAPREFCHWPSLFASPQRKQVAQQVFLRSDTRSQEWEVWV